MPCHATSCQLCSPRISSSGVVSRQVMSCHDILIIIIIIIIIMITIIIIIIIISGSSSRRDFVPIFVRHCSCCRHSVAAAAAAAAVADAAVAVRIMIPRASFCLPVRKKACLPNQADQTLGPLPKQCCAGCWRTTQLVLLSLDMAIFAGCTVVKNSTSCLRHALLKAACIVRFL